jgi:2-keto-3-deoxy-L-rhamnonate aldolase RhmA
MNKIKRKLAAGQVVTMFNPDFQSPRLVEYLAGFGLDVSFIDAERMSYDFQKIEEMTRAAHVAGIASVARAWMNDPGLIVRYFDCGLDGMSFPHVEDAASARRMVDIVRYARPRDHAEKIVIVMAETPDAIGRLSEIVAVPGIDVVNIGVNDVALALGHPGEPEHPKVVKLVDQGIERILKGGKTVALNVLTNWEERIPSFIEKGVRWLNVHANVFIARGAQQYSELLKHNVRAARRSAVSGKNNKRGKQ